MNKIFFCFLFFSIPPVANENEITGKVIVILDGNTLEVSTEKNETYRIILKDIDCPEINQEFGTDARDFLRQRLFHQQVVVSIHGKDRLKNYIGVVFRDLKDVRLELLEQGLAWTAEKGPDPGLELYRTHAAKNRTGLWKQDAPTPPWIYRRLESMSEAKSR